MHGPLIVVDTETTGFNGQPWSCIVEIGAVALDVDGSELSCFSSLVRPTKAWDDRMAHALVVSGLPWETLLQAPSSETVYQAFSYWAWTARAGATCTAFNLPFDRAMCRAQGWQMPWGDLCLMSAYERYARERGWMMGQKGKRLSDAAERLGIEAGTAHRALDDARTAATVWRLLPAGL